MAIEARSNAKHTTQRLETESFNVRDSLLKICSAVVILDEVNDVEHGQHARESRVLAVPQWRGDNTWR